jgi:arabinose-5-phosphate isomerase
VSLSTARDVIAIEAKAVAALVKHINADFLKAVDLLTKCQGRVVVSGMGKTGIIGRKISATLSSTGTPSIFLHSAEAVHGDLGQVTPNDVMIVISNSGETEETVRLLPLIKRINTKTIAMTSNPNSALGRYSDVVLNIGVEKEGCPLGLAPMASTTATLVMGDALAACLIVRKGFKKEDFAFYHPGGALGRRLLLKVEDLMRTGHRFASVRSTWKIREVLLAITRARCGSACVLDGRGKLVGIFTDGDLRRHLESEPNVLETAVAGLMTTSPTTIGSDQLAAEALRVMKEKKIDEIPVVDKKGMVIGLLDVQDILAAGVV